MGARLFNESRESKSAVLVSSSYIRYGINLKTQRYELMRHNLEFRIDPLKSNHGLIIKQTICHQLNSQIDDIKVGQTKDIPAVMILNRFHCDGSIQNQSKIDPINYRNDSISFVIDYKIHFNIKYFYRNNRDDVIYNKNYKIYAVNQYLTTNIFYILKDLKITNKTLKYEQLAFERTEKQKYSIKVNGFIHRISDDLIICDDIIGLIVMYCTENREIKIHQETGFKKIYYNTLRELNIKSNDMLIVYRL
eukprot:24726_1